MQAEIVPPFPFSKDCRMMKIPVVSRLGNATFCNSFQYGHLLWNLKDDPEQLVPVDDPEKEAEFINAIMEALKDCCAPEEQYIRLGISPDIRYDGKRVLEERKKVPTFESFEITKKYQWTPSAKNIFIGMLSLMEEKDTECYFASLEEEMNASGKTTVGREVFEHLAEKFYSTDKGKVFYFLNKLERIR